MSHNQSRRSFLEMAAAGAASLALGGVPSARAAGRLMFVNFATYVEDRNKVNASRAEHQVYADALRENGHLVTGGPILGDDGRPSGVLLIYSAASRQEAENFVQRDPFVLQGAIESYRLDEWTDVDSNAELLAASLVAPERRAPASAGTGAMRTYVSHVKFTSDRSRHERAGSVHREYEKGLKAGGQLLMAGPFANGSGAMFIYRAKSKHEATALLLKDPYLTEGVVGAHTLLEWRMFGLNQALL